MQSSAGEPAVAPLEATAAADVEMTEAAAAEEEDALADALDVAKANGDVEALTKLVTEYPDRVEDEAGCRCKEEAIYALARLYASSHRFDEIVSLLSVANAPFLEKIAKAKTAKIVRRLLEIVSQVPGSLEIQAELCERVVAWCRAEKRTFLRQRVESRLVAIDYERGRYDQALVLVNRLLTELKKLDDKMMLVETHLVEARIHAALRNVPKAKAALTAARTNGNAVYVGPRLQAALDEMSGSLHCEESDYATSYSYFLEAFEGYDSLDDGAKATTCLKYMLLCQILADEDPAAAALHTKKSSDEDSSSAPSSKPPPKAASKRKKWATLQNSKNYVKYAGRDLDSMTEIAKAAKSRSLEAFEQTTRTYATELQADLLIKHHLDQLYDSILEANLAKIIEPFSRVEIQRVADIIGLPVPKVEKKLAQMILDKELHGTLAQGTGHLIVHDQPDDDPIYEASVEVIKNMGDVVESLFRKITPSEFDTHNDDTSRRPRRCPRRLMQLLDDEATPDRALCGEVTDRPRTD